MNAKQQLMAIIHSRRIVLLSGLLLLLLERASALVLPASTRFLVDDVIGKHELNRLAPLLAMVAAATLFQALASFTLNRTLARESEKVIAMLRCKLQAHLSRLPISYFDSSKAGTLIARVLNDVEGLRKLLGSGLVEFSGQLLTCIVVLLILARISFRMTAIIVACFAVLITILNHIFKRTHAIFRERSRVYGELTGRLGESIGGIRVVKGYHAEDSEERVFRSGVERLRQVICRTATASSVMRMCAAVAVGIIAMLVMYLGSGQIAAKRLSLGSFVSYVVFMGILVMPLGQLTSIAPQIGEAMAGLQRACELLNERREDADPNRTAAMAKVQGRIEFDNVSFCYEPDKWVLKNVSFLAEPGTVTALVGPSGSGKSTVLGLIAAFYSAQEGRILIDGIDIKTIRLDHYRKNLGVVFQDSVLFDGTIRENVAFVAPNATEKEILRACHIAHVDEFANRWELGYDTVIGERGVKLSGGQRQRLSIARALMVNPKILILDEATSSLDSVSELFVQEGLMSLMKDRTTFVIAHRLSTVQRADQIVVMEKGRIVEIGTHDSLYASKGRYFELCTAQLCLEANRIGGWNGNKDATATEVTDGRDIHARYLATAHTRSDTLP